MVFPILMIFAVFFTVLSSDQLGSVLSKSDLKRLEMYSQNMVDYHLIMDLLQPLARLFFLSRIGSIISKVQQAILLGMGLQMKSVDTLEKELDLPASQILGHLIRMIGNFSKVNIVRSSTWLHFLCFSFFVCIFDIAVYFLYIMSPCAVYNLCFACNFLSKRVCLSKDKEWVVC